jgi:hypothetical protein
VLSTRSGSQVSNGCYRPARMKLLRTKELMEECPLRTYGTLKDRGASAGGPQLFPRDGNDLFNRSV